MSVQGEIDRIKGNVAASYAAVSAKGGVLPETQNSENLSEAIESIPTSGGGSSMEVYDDQERVIGTWFGEPLYRRSYEITGTTNSGGDKFTTFVDDPQKKLVNAYGYAEFEQGRYAIPFSSSKLGISVYNAKAGLIQFVTHWDSISNYTAKLSIEYTKTTD